MTETQTKVCQNCKSQFVIEPDDFAFYKKIQVPPPTFCPSCREQRRMAHRNERFLYKDQCDLCKKSIFSIYSPEKPFTVYCREYWNSDRWDPLAYGREYDWNTPFFLQFRKLMEDVPRLALVQYRSIVNADYANFVLDVKNVYLAVSVLYSENVFYSKLVDYCKECFDSFNVRNSEMIYGIVDGARNYNSKFLLRSRNCIDSSFLFDCANCSNCFMSSNLRNRQYVFRNKQLTKGAYAGEIGKANLGSFNELENLKQEFRGLLLHSLHKFANVIKVVNCTGDNVENSKNIHHSFDVYDSQDIKFSIRVIGEGPVYDAYGSKAQLAYEVVTSGLGSSNMRFVTHTDSAKDSFYIDWCRNTSHLFGCTTLKSQSHCILNKKYTKEEYNALVPKIIKHMDEMPYVDKKGKIYKFGEFFPANLSPWSYNETIAEEYHPLSKEQALDKGYGWRDPDPYQHKPTINSKDLPDDIKDASDSILNEVIGYPACGRAYKIIQPELDFLRRQKIALPRLCLECRYGGLFAMRNPLKFWHRTCQCAGRKSEIRSAKSETLSYQNTAEHFHGDNHCPNEFETSYAPGRPEFVYCEQCYNAEVV